MIHVSGLTKSYGQWPVLSDVDLDLPDGELIGLVGANGAGKSTLLSVMARLLGADAGTVEVGGLNVATTPSDELAKVLCVLKQDNHMLVRLTVRDLVSFGRYPHNHGRPTEHDDAVVEKALAWMDLNDLAGRYLDQMSGGQRQRLALARALLARPGVLILDEFTSHLDPDLDERVRIGVRTYLPQATIIEITHRLQWSEQADHVVVMDAGVIVQAGQPAKLLAEPGPLRTLIDRGR